MRVDAVTPVINPAWMSWFLPGREAFDDAYARAQGLGYEISMEPTNEPWNMREFHPSATRTGTPSA